MSALFSHRTIFASLLIAFALAPAVASAKTVELLSIRALKTQEADGDELQIRLALDNKAPVVYSRAMKTGNIWVLNTKHTFYGKMELGLYEMDGTVSQSLGSTLLSPAPGLHVLNFTAGGVNYRMEYKIHPDPPRTFVLRLNWLHAKQLQETSWPDKGDELQLRINADGKSSQLNRNITRTLEVWNLHKDIPFTKSVTLNLYEEDLAFDDFIGGRTFTAKDVGKSWETVVLAGSGARYVLSFSVHER